MGRHSPSRGFCLEYPASHLVPAPRLPLHGPTTRVLQRPLLYQVTYSHPFLTLRPLGLIRAKSLGQGTRVRRCSCLVSLQT